MPRLRTAGWMLAALLLAPPGAALADDTAAALDRLERAVEDPATSWEDRYAAFLDAKAAIEASGEDSAAAQERAALDIAQAGDAVREAFETATEAFGKHSDKALELAEAKVVLAAGRQPRVPLADLQTEGERVDKAYSVALGDLRASDLGTTDATESVPAAFRSGEAHLAASLRYVEMRPKVADALRRDSVPLSGWIMGLFGAALLWGGATICIIIAFRSGKSGTEQD